ncbi:hypothetical protein ACS0TY_005676 [Phlomoides rotata]
MDFSVRLAELVADNQREIQDLRAKHEMEKRMLRREQDKLMFMLENKQTLAVCVETLQKDLQNCESDGEMDEVETFLRRAKGLLMRADCEFEAQYRRLFR